MPKPKWEFRDICYSLQVFREFLLGRKHNLHGRFTPIYAPRSIPPPDIPRGPEYKYSNQYYVDRSAPESVSPAIVAPIAEGPPSNQDPYKKIGAGGMKPDQLKFCEAPVPGLPWWWDGHCFYEVKADPYYPNEKPTCPTVKKC